MLVKPKHKKLILNLRDPTKVTNVLPTAGTILYKGVTLTVVPHRTQEVRVLRNLGINAPSPMDYYYSWPIRHGWAPMEHQRTTATFLASHNRAYCLNDLGTAKTLSSLWAYDFLKQEGSVDKLLVVSPLSTVERTWADEIFTNLPHLSHVVVYGSREQRHKLLSEDVDVYIINHDGVKVVLDALESMKFSCVIIDELAQVARNSGTDRWKALKRVTKDSSVVWGLTGTPIPNEPTDAWAQCRLLTPSTVPAYYSHFRSRVMQQVATYKWVPRDDALDVVHEAMQPGIRFKRDEVIDLPPIMYETRQTPLTVEQKRMFDEMTNELYTEYKGHGISAVNEGVKAMKLVQICCGSAIGDNDTIVAPPKHRLIELVNVIEEAAAKVIVFVPFRAPLAMIADVLSKRYAVEQIHGGVGKTERSRIFKAFQSSHGGAQVLVAQPAAMSHGLTLTEANVIVWFAPVNSAEIYEQANGRITRPGQKHNQFIIHLQGTWLEANMYKRLKNKSDMQGVLLDMFKKGVD
jgi:SNF2 family DNA or RNA helicase